MDIKLKQWAEAQLGQKCVEVGWETLQEQFNVLMDKAKKSKDHDDIFDLLKEAVTREAMNRHAWEDKAAEMLRLECLLAYCLSVMCSVVAKFQGDPTEHAGGSQRHG